MRTPKETKLLFICSPQTDSKGLWLKTAPAQHIEHRGVAQVPAERLHLYSQMAMVPDGSLYSTERGSQTPIQLPNFQYTV